MNILTPTGYKDITEVNVGDEVCAFDTTTGLPIINILTSKDIYTEDEWGSEDHFGTFIHYKINGSLVLFKYQSIWANLNIKHAYQLEIGDTIYDDNDQDVLVTSIEEITDIKEWIRITINHEDLAADHSYICEGFSLHNASRYLVSGGTGNWNSTTNWAATDGAASGASFPVATDDVFMTTLSANANIAVNVASACLTVQQTGTYAGTFNFQNTLTTSGTIVKWNSGCTFANTSGTANWNLTGSPTITSNAKTFPYLITFTTAATTKTLADALTVKDLTIATTTNTISGAFTITISGTLTMTGNMAAAGGFAATGFVFNGGVSTTQSWLGSGQVSCNVDINTSGNMVIGATSVNTVLSNATLKYTTAASLTQGGTSSTLQLNGTITLNTSGTTFTRILFNTGGNVSFTSDFNVGSVTTPGFLTISNVTLNAGNINLTNSTLSMNASQAAATGNTIYMYSGGTITSVTPATPFAIFSNLNLVDGAFTHNAAYDNYGTVTIGSGVTSFSSTAASIIRIRGTAITFTNNMTGLVLNQFEPYSTTGTINGTQGFDMKTFRLTIGGSIALLTSFKFGNVYRILNTMAWNSTGQVVATLQQIKSDTPGSKVVFTLMQGATQNNSFLDATDIDSSAGKTICVYDGVFSNTNNWRQTPTDVQTVCY